MSDVLVFSTGSADSLAICANLRAQFRSLFIVVFDEAASQSALIRQSAGDSGVNMVTSSIADLTQVIETIRTHHIASPGIARCVCVLVVGAEWLVVAAVAPWSICLSLLSSDHLSLVYIGGKFRCPYCPKVFGSLAHLHEHSPLYHILYVQSKRMVCTVCGNKQVKNMAVHLHEQHAPEGYPHPNDTKSPLYGFAMVVCRRPSDGKFLLVQEFANEGYYLPGMVLVVVTVGSGGCVWFRLSISQYLDVVRRRCSRWRGDISDGREA